MGDKCNKCGKHISGQDAAGTVEDGIKLCLKCLLDYFKVRAVS
ncbi:hypothetical protein DCCM_2256 [Desulfocucumis palustris]|uniref:Uncharacterized protein n=1 Tax=Desulfocucumis palustris TaxID=1898651 RepID=A0A2L2XA52_9FIRM|nr:hypothetical protein [Desulfocucumis palustris]GBF33159.1 hypothetical protein DCCM_2256 [Desulfocucumis palustris]